MKPTTGRRLVDDTLDHLAYVKDHLAHAWANLEDWSGVGYPNGAGNGNHGKGGKSDPTARAATQALSRAERDQFERELAELAADITTLESAARRIRTLTEATVNTTDIPGAPGCSVCARIEATDLQGNSQGRPHEHSWQPIYTRRPSPKRPDGPNVPYCSFCTDWIDRYSEEPAKEIARWHLEHLGSKVPHAMARDYHPAAFERVHGQRRRAS